MPTAVVNRFLGAIISVVKYDQVSKWRHRAKSVISIDVIMLATAQLEHYACHSVRLWKAYCGSRGYAFHRYSDQLISDMHINWSKIEMVCRHLRQTKADVIVLVDADTYVCPDAVGIEELLQGYQDKEIVFARDCRMFMGIPVPLNIPAVLRHHTPHLPNAGFIAIRNGEFSRWFFDEWLSLARNRLSYLANTHPRNQRVLWNGLYFQNIENLGLLGRQVERIYGSREIASTCRNGASFIHVKGGLEEPYVKRFIECVERATLLAADTSMGEV